MCPRDPYYRPDLALVHHLGFGFHADACAPGILALLGPVRERGGLVLELGCGSGLLTRHLVDAGHRGVATDASPAMVDLAREYAAGAEEIRVLQLPDDPLPPADAVVSVGHVVSYLDDRPAVERALVSIAGADRFVRDIATFLRNDDGSWRRDDERHENVLLDTSVLPELLAGSGVDVTLRTSFGTEALPAGLRVLVGRRPLP